MQFTSTTENQCVLLYDDLAAELDATHRKLILSVLSSMNIQLFLTAIEKDQLDLSAWREIKMFHVEHGCVEPYS
jgi:DNA replication and repair protein RecF